MKDKALDQALAHTLTLSLPNARAGKSGSVALSRSGALYHAGSVESETHLLTISSELAALVRAAHATDVVIEKMNTVVSDATTPISPLTLKLLADHSTRTGITISYTVRDTKGTTLFETKDVHTSLPFYKNKGVVLSSIVHRVPQPAKARLEKSSNTSLELELRKWALEGCERNFPTREGASGYGAAVLTKSGNIYYGGQYSTFEHRLGVHAEMGVLLNALMDGVRDITHIGIVSTKFTDTPCSPCGCCRQFMAEMSRAYHFSPTLCLFASRTDTYTTHTIEELLPVQWTNTNGHKH